jgi:hypothetical protein
MNRRRKVVEKEEWDPCGPKINDELYKIKEWGIGSGESIRQNEGNMIQENE